LAWNGFFGHAPACAGAISSGRTCASAEALRAPVGLAALRAVLRDQAIELAPREAEKTLGLEWFGHRLGDRKGESPQVAKR